MSGTLSKIVRTNPDRGGSSFILRLYSPPYTLGDILPRTDFGQKGAFKISKMSYSIATFHCFELLYAIGGDPQ